MPSSSEQHLMVKVFSDRHRPTKWFSSELTRISILYPNCP
ncbi:hypothetical protein BURPS305_4775 [Burkholderia pseudomallei 305]|nr:hypothetical protein GBP346_A0476 [Burkholderia pseudomallei MSHR346]EBA49010.1 hypothetical protein BURPS305_4775 [Burkholderia pseudomallei 305]EEP88240.1 hypothetical protein BMAGB8_3268 [Burkholderia mallei GB8 horse 4]